MFKVNLQLATVSLWARTFLLSLLETNTTAVYFTELIETSLLCRVSYFVNEWKSSEDQTNLI